MSNKFRFSLGEFSGAGEPHRHTNYISINMAAWRIKSDFG